MSKKPMFQVKEVPNATVPSTVSRKAVKLSDSYIAFRTRMAGAAGFCFKQQDFITGKWYSVPRSSAEHISRMLQLDETIAGLVSRGK